MGPDAGPGGAWATVVDVEAVRLALPLVAVSLGFGLGQVDAWRRNRQGAAGARLLLRMEIDDNLDEVRRYRREATERDPRDVLPPTWTREAWASQLPRLPAALGVAELARARCVYARLDQLTEHHHRARAAEDPAVRGREAAAAAEIAEDLLRDGNALDPPRSAEARRWALNRVRRRRGGAPRLSQAKQRGEPGPAWSDPSDATAPGAHWARDLPTVAAVVAADAATGDRGGAGA